MAEPKVVHATGHVRRVFSKPAETVFAMLADTEKFKSWYGAGDHHDLLEFTVQFAEGGELLALYRFRPGSPVAGMTLENRGRYLSIIPNERVITTGFMSMDGRVFSASLVTFELVPQGTGTELVITHQDAFFEHADGPEMRQAGWVSLLNRLERELEGETVAHAG